MNLTPLTTDLNAHQNLADQPTLTASELKVAWDKPANDIKTYINNVLIPELNSFASSVSADVTTKLQAMYPVGRVIYTEEAINPAQVFGFGTWSLTGQGKFMVGYDPNNTKFDEGGKTGGNLSITLNANQIPTIESDSNAVTGLTKSTNNKADLTYQAGGTVVTDVATTTGKISITNGSQQAVDITPAYQVLYMYKRIS